MGDIRLITYDPGHFHAALVQKEMYPGVSLRSSVYARLGPDLLAHLGRIAGFNKRAINPTRWELDIHTSDDPLGAMLRDRPGNVVVFSGRNRGKIEALVAAVEAGLHVLADKPLAIRVEDLALLQKAGDRARAKGVVILDIMTERHEITTRLQRELVNDPETFGAIDQGTEDRPGVFLESVHYLCKSVAGVPNRRPWWFFDVEQQGEGLTDVGTHLVDLVPWILFPEQAIVAARDLQILKASRTATQLSKPEFQRVTGESEFPLSLASNLISGHLLYHCNNTLSYTLRGIHVWLNIAWGFEAGANQGDRHFARFRGTRSAIEVRQGEAEDYRPEVYIVPNQAKDGASIEAAVRHKLEDMRTRFPGVGMEEVKGAFRLTIPERLRTGHEAHFGEVTRQFLGYIGEPTSMPAWELPNLLAKYHLTTHGVQLARLRS